ncbi:hypothetical protein K443DRAFT_114936 [Laccaria amethystina LaAM-08-1]|uniref:Nephrocystin 3-like N-terminal domain-containing protein n=1 Tax=Laccaria amethystina LaAM-08-1 TaxID=1095629 RepID=A0A0C9WMZ9_9AGAR|nr:hypothetical protein K443DRAFT_114936 [Laccaria amethystina LaAM-08-1]
MQFLHLRPRIPQPTESSIDIAATQPPTTPLPPQLAGNVGPPVLNPHDIEPTSTKLEKVFAKGKSFKRDMAILSIAYTLQECSELKRLIQLIVVIRDKDSEDQLTEVLETCARFSVQLASANDAQRAEATRAITAFNEPDRSECLHPSFRTVENLKTIQLNGDGKSLDGLMDMIKEDIDRIKPSFMSDGELGTSERLSKVLDITLGTTISILTLVQEASSLIPVPTLGSIAGECDKLSQRKLLSRFFHQSAHMGDLQDIRIKLNAAIQLFQTENSVNIKLDTEELNRKIDFASLNGLPSHPEYIRNEYFEKSRDDVIQDVSDWIDNAPESVLWVHGAAGLGKSTVAQELVHLLKSEDRLVGGVFLTNLTTEPPEGVVQMISRQLGAMYPRAIANIAEAARTLDGPHDRLKDYFTAYIFDPIRALQYPYQLVVVVDGLEEWRNYESFLAELVHISSPSPLKFVLTSRFNYSIERAVDKMPTRKYALPPASQTVIEHYFHHHFLSGDINWRGRKPDDDQIHRLAARADGLLIWAATARLLVTNKFDTRYPHEILDQILSSEKKLVNQKDGAEDGQLARLYRGAISTLFPPQIRATLRKFLAATVVLQEALPIADFAHLSGIPGPATEEIHQRLAALQTQGDPKTNLISPAIQRFHSSFIEFITRGSDDQTFQAISITEAHSILANRCLEIVFVELLPSFRGKTCSYPDLRGVEPYAVKFWPLHFSSGTTRQKLAPPSGTVGMDLISEEAMRHWATLFLRCIAARFQDGHNSLDGIQKSVLPYKVAVMIGMEDVTTLSYHIQCLEIATRLQPLDMGTWQALGVAYRRLHEQSQSNRDLDEEITAFRHGLEPGPHPDRSTSLNNLATALATRFKKRGASNDLDEAISLHREALLLWPAPHPDRSMSLNNLANALQTPISLHQEGLLLRPAPHPDRSRSLNNLGIALQIRFKQRGAPNDLDEAISVGREALLLRPAHHPQYSNLLRRLVVSLRIRFDRGHLLHDINEAISLHERLLDCPVEDPNRSWSLKRLPAALSERQALISDHVDIVEGTNAEEQSLM